MTLINVNKLLESQNANSYVGTDLKSCSGDSIVPERKISKDSGRESQLSNCETECESRDNGIVLLTILLSYANFCLGCTFSMLGPIFPSEAKSREVPELFIGLIIGQYRMSEFFGAILFGKFIGTTSEPKFLITSGLLLTGVANIAFGLKVFKNKKNNNINIFHQSLINKINYRFLQWSSSSLIFIYIGIVLRTFEGFGAAAFFISSLSIVSKYFTQNLSRTYALTEFSFGIGMVFGPMITGILNQYGDKFFKAGFCSPFFMFGTFLVIGSIISYYLNKITGEPQIIATQSCRSLIKNFSISLNLFIAINCCFLIGFNEVTLDLHLKTIEEVSSSIKGCIFALTGASYAISIQIWGEMSNKLKDSYIISIMGMVLAIACFIITAPLPFLPIKPCLWLVILGQGLLGLGLGGQYVGSFVQGFRETVLSGFHETISTYVAIFGCFYAAYAFGSATGPVIGGYLLDKYGYITASVLIVGLQLFIILVLIIFNLFRGIKRIISKSSDYVDFS